MKQKFSTLQKIFFALSRRGKQIPGAFIWHGGLNSSHYLKHYIREPREVPVSHTSFYLLLTD